jgi:hypothetical protein
MIDFETRQALIAICETLKLQSMYLAALHRSVVRMYEATKMEMPSFEPAYDATNPEMQEYPGNAELLRKVDALLSQLKKIP